MRRPRAPRTARTLAALVAGALALTACGDDGSEADRAQDALDDILEEARDAAEAAGDDVADDADDDADDDQASGPAEAEPPEFTLTGPVEAPADTVLDPASCISPDESGPPFFDHYVPADWIRRGAGASGSGGVTMSGDHRYELPDGTMVNLDVETESYVDGEPAGPDLSTPWETWDFDITEFGDAGEVTTRITYEELDPVEIDGESFDLYFLDQAQSDLVSASEYKLRITFAEVPTGGVAPQDRRPESAEVTFSWDAEDGDVPEEQVRELLSTFRLAECAQEGLVEFYETVTGADFSD